MRPPLLLVLAVFVLLGAGCAKRAPAVTTPTVPTAPPSATAPTAAPTLADAMPSLPLPTPVAAPPDTPTPRVIRVTAKQFTFEPEEIRVRRGERVVLEVTSADVTHGIAIPSLDINRELPPNETVRIEFTAPDAPGRHPVICSVYCGVGHRDMRRAIIVE